MEQLQHYLEFRGTMPRVHVRAHHQSAATRFREKVRKSVKNKNQKIERKKWFALESRRPPPAASPRTERARCMLPGVGGGALLPREKGVPPTRSVQPIRHFTPPDSCPSTPSLFPPRLPCPALSAPGPRRIRHVRPLAAQRPRLCLFPLSASLSPLPPPIPFGRCGSPDGGCCFHHPLSFSAECALCSQAGLRRRDHQ